MNIVITPRPTYCSDEPDPRETLIEAYIAAHERCETEIEQADEKEILLARQMRERGFHVRAKLRKLYNSERQLGETPAFELAELREGLAELGYKEELALFERLIRGEGDTTLQDNRPEITDLEELLTMSVKPPQTVRQRLAELNEPELEKLRPLAREYFDIRDGEQEDKLIRARERARKRLENAPTIPQPIIYVRR